MSHDIDKPHYVTCPFMAPIGWKMLFSSSFDRSSTHTITQLPISIEQIALSTTYDHREWRTGLPVRSAVLKPLAGWLVVGWVTTSESQLLYVFCCFFAEQAEQVKKRYLYLFMILKI